MGKVKEVLVELSNGQEAVITTYGLTLTHQEGTGDMPYAEHISTADLEAAMAMIKYLREMRPFETLAEIVKNVSGPFTPPAFDIPDLETLPEVPAPQVSTKKTLTR